MTFLLNQVRARDIPWSAAHSASHQAHPYRPVLRGRFAICSKLIRPNGSHLTRVFPINAGLGRGRPVARLPPEVPYAPFRTSPTRANPLDMADLTPALDLLESDPSRFRTVALPLLLPGTLLTLHTRNTCYRMVVVDGSERRVQITGGKLFSRERLTQRSSAPPTTRSQGRLDRRRLPARAVDWPWPGPDVDC